MYRLHFFLFFFNDTATTEIYTLSLHDALPIWSCPTPRPMSLLPDYASAFHSPPTPCRRVFSCSWITWTASGNALAIDFLAISDAQDQNHQTIVFDLADEPVIAHAIFPELSKPRAVQRLSDAARIVELGNPLMKELQDALAVLRVEFVEFPV